MQRNEDEEENKHTFRIVCVCVPVHMVCTGLLYD